jgi:transcriptional regulator GlxA family with amidase domain
MVEILVTIVRESGRERTQKSSPLVQEALKLMKDNLAQPLSIPEIVGRLGWGPSHFFRVFRTEMGMPPAQYYLNLRLREGKRLLEGSTRSVTEVAHDLGFSSSQYFANAFRRMLGSSPRESRQGS